MAHDLSNTSGGRMWLMDLDRPPPLVTARLPAEMGRVTLAEAPALADAMDVAPGVVAGRLQTGRRGYTAWVSGRVAAYGWVSLQDEDIGEQNLRLRLLVGEAYLWDFATLPEFQRRGLYSALLSHIVRALRADGLARAWIGADLSNAPSQAGIERAGFTPVADLLWGDGPGGRRLRGLPGVPPALVAAARWALLGER